ncbi:retron Ec78 anti-phage system effector HNH endonuclease PtuB [Aeromonas caviae]
MRKLTRNPLIPDVLAQYNANTDSWSLSSPNKKSRKIIWRAINSMQSDFCCYCEKRLSGDKHIEHFFHKGQSANGVAPFKHMTFQWDNLFGCCGRNSGITCGHYKDSQGKLSPGHYDPFDIIKPDIDNPLNYIVFSPEGYVEEKQGLLAVDKKRAIETLRVLNLTHSSLNGARKKQISIFENELKQILSLNLPDDAFILAIEDMRNRIKKSEFQSAILCALKL